ncbi:LacI family transcriptional regulator [Natranaerovirga hydrolytica]|uniref:LacI family transcriptional regulator n=1 Tax=Natranaerovirga hydrolytica TaxID=680378 RepID=A0A4V2Q087_9FIRM|nr:LacI family DNA-binding transcriptional regulator [Natranaerovirga hydrolytica]TCK92711.1 LacI family transcriptional regulator [Natranaerovirga hydrolytica]
MTIYDIAKEAGVSASTVSRVINNKPGIKEETREKVKELLEKYNYVPNVAARGLVMQKSKTIGILVADVRVAHHIEGAYIIEKELAAIGYYSIILNTGHKNEEKEKYIKALEQRRVDGIILIGSTFQCDYIKEVIRKSFREIPVIIANGYIDLPNVYGIIIDELNGIKDCVNLLHSKGHTKLAFVLDHHTPSNYSKKIGFMEAMIQEGWQEDQLWLYETTSSVEGGYHITKEIVKEHPDIEGIVFSVDITAVGAIRALMDLKISVPEQVSITGVDNTIFGEISYPKLTSLDNKLKDLSRFCAKVLIDVLEGKDTPKKMMLFTSIVEREST